MTTEDISYLSNFKQFGRLLKDIRSFREGAISDLANAPTDRIQQISGRILAYDEILRSVDAEEVIKKTDNLP